MSVHNNILNNQNDSCCRECSGEICASFIINSVQMVGGQELINFSMVGDPNIKKTCNKQPLNANAERALEEELKGKISVAFKEYIDNLSSVGNYYVQPGQIFKMCANFKAEICSKNKEFTINIKEFIVVSTS